MPGSSETAEYKTLLRFTENVAEAAQKSNGFVCRQGLHGYHILFNESEMMPYFDMIRDSLTKGQAGSCLQEALKSEAVRIDYSNNQIWHSLIQSLDFSGRDFEHLYHILPVGEATEDRIGIWRYSFAESIVLSHTLLLVPVMQHYGPLMPKLDLKGPTKKFEQPRALLAVGMIGDCVKGTVFDDIKQKADAGDERAKRQRDTLLNPERLQQKMHALLRALLLAREECDIPGLLLDTVLVGSGAFGGSVKVLAQPFADCLNGGDLPFDNSKDEVNFFMFPPPKPDEFTLEPMKYKASLNNRKGLGSSPDATDNRVRVVVAGFDPVSLAPHGVWNRVFSAEGQLCHTTDLLHCLTSVPGKFLRVHVPEGRAWESPAAFFAKPQELKFKMDGAYDTVRFVPEPILRKWGLEEGREADTCLEATERVPPRVWNGDSFDGWTLSCGGVAGQTWQEILHPKLSPCKKSIAEEPPPKRPRKSSA